MQWVRWEQWAEPLNGSRRHLALALRSWCWCWCCCWCCGSVFNESHEHSTLRMRCNHLHVPRLDRLGRLGRWRLSQSRASLYPHVGRGTRLVGCELEDKTKGTGTTDQCQNQDQQDQWPSAVKGRCLGCAARNVLEGVEGTASMDS